MYDDDGIFSVRKGRDPCLYSVEEMSANEIHKVWLTLFCSERLGEYPFEAKMPRATSSEALHVTYTDSVSKEMSSCSNGKMEMAQTCSRSILVCRNGRPERPTRAESMRRWPNPNGQ